MKDYLMASPPHDVLDIRHYTLTIVSHGDCLVKLPSGINITKCRIVYIGILGISCDACYWHL